ncbi:putative protein serine/threonine kinase [Heterostelium album PN500]|uniref:non-specific serine/threonine protein kinase n=1 Tax=Heterostelium pallidum (strain ATCC 26659 / Pp 5 / PN500) TaxID=670386 RepID=D3B199_HETP5|nr:putative protein serine/threonine kinase [Heterostelium album PN500]EFA85073.1 putative protein serine/threonine kinase [Heterostelium album PN500]|eukprot:XP_020437183.1 putative protein serine/threonine kinase [Heterostelium album PN500]
MEPISIASLENRLNRPSEPEEVEFNYKLEESSNIDIKSFEILSTIGNGSYGEVFIVKQKDTENVYALKKIPYHDVFDSELVIKRAKRERDAMVACNTRGNNRGPKLHYAFIDKEEATFNLVMEYLPGGDFNSHCYKRQCDNNSFTMQEIQFYIAELVVCIEQFHNMGWLHRDVKPENLMINRDGHLVLCDYGSSKQIVNTNSADKVFGNTPPNFTSFLRNPSCSYTSYVGTPQYMAVEVVQGIIYSKLCDYWSLGAILFELITGQGLFVESPDTTEQKIRENIGNWRGLLNTAISKNQPIPKVAESLIRDLIAPERKRLDSNAIKKHPFFEGIDWLSISTCKATPPFVPNISHPTDTSHFGQ